MRVYAMTVSSTVKVADQQSDTTALLGVTYETAVRGTTQRTVLQFSPCSSPVGDGLKRVHA